jgi:very-short-patch-repair endonuclease
MTMPERILWSKLKDKQLGVNVYPQSIVYGYILDFWIPCKICVEVDGPCHDNRKGYDLKRDLVLKANGIDTMRFKADEVMNNLNAVLALIQAKVRQKSVD